MSPFPGIKPSQPHFPCLYLRLSASAEPSPNIEHPLVLFACDTITIALPVVIVTQVLVECIRDLFFYDNCQGPVVLLGDFTAGLIAAMVESGMGVDCELSAARLDDLGSKCFLQIYN